TTDPMPPTPLVTAGIETALNTFPWRDKALKPARQRLLGKVLRVQLQDFATPVVLVFSERQVDVLSAWGGVGVCCLLCKTIL
ncbi:SCP2 sterol-binding domain-containing protein, partial [Pseudomonas aeruginosa]|uniref:SCP2 sterol-binding domain-containing protein n=1 Tax=Pseudomonas aeruginosa TaxID=287 RepID=UPI00396AAF1F